MPSARTTGKALIVLGSALPGVTYAVARVAVAIDVRYGGPPNQGAMVLAYLSFLGSLALGLLLIATGAFILVRSYWVGRRQLDGPAQG